LLHSIISDNSLDILALQETWLTPEDPPAIPRDIAPAGFTVLHVFRDTSQADSPAYGGGLAVVARGGLRARPHPLASSFRPKHFELQLVRLGEDSCPITVANVYRRPSSAGRPNPVPAFIEELSEVLASVTAGVTDRLLICGDVNCPGSVGTSTVDPDLVATLESFGFNQRVLTPTRENNILDIVADVSSSLAAGVTVVEAGCIPYHRLIVVDLLARRPANPTVAYRYRDLRKVDPSQFEAQLRASPLFHSPSSTAEGFANQLASVVCQELDKVAPLRSRTRRRSKPITRWLSAEAVHAKRARRRLERRWHKTRSEADRTAYRKSCRRANYLINASRRNYYSLRLQNCSDAGQRWRTVKELLHVSPADSYRSDRDNSLLCDKFATFLLLKLLI
jgi:hypothetical protein